MNDTPNHEENWEVQLRDIARHLAYPPTPDLAGNVYEALHPPRHHRTGRVMLRFGTMAAMFVLTLMLVPDIRAQVLEAIRLGDSSVRIETIKPTPQGAIVPPNVLNVPENTVPHVSILDLPGEVATSLVQARSIFPAPLRLPTYPENLGQPDVVYVLKTGNPYVIVGWLNENGSDLALSLHMVDSDSYVSKQFLDGYGKDEISITQVNERDAYWTTTKHTIEIYATNSGLLDRYSWQVVSNVLIWTAGPLTYRLETYVSLDEAVKIAESLQ